MRVEFSDIQIPPLYIPTNPFHSKLILEGDAAFTCEYACGGVIPGGIESRIVGGGFGENNIFLEVPPTFHIMIQLIVRSFYARQNRTKFPINLQISDLKPDTQ